MPEAFNADTLDAMCDVRRVFDPEARANPGKVLPHSRLPRVAAGGAGMSDALLDSLSRIAGPALVERDGQGVPRVVPDSPSDGGASSAAPPTAAGWRVRIEGRASWLPADAPADFAISTRGLDRVVSVSPADLVATVEAGVTLDRVRRELAASGLWLALDPPGHPERTIGSIFATGTAGALRQGFGPVRDHVLGCTVVTGDGRIIEAGGRVVKNVAGYDLTTLQVGGFGAFGVITSLHLRLRALPADGRHPAGPGRRDRLTHAARSLVAAAASLAGLELFSPALAADAEWILAARCLGPAEAAGPEVANLTGDDRARVGAPGSRPGPRLLEPGGPRAAGRAGFAAAWVPSSTVSTTCSTCFTSTSTKGWSRRAPAPAQSAGRATLRPSSSARCGRSRRTGRFRSPSSGRRAHLRQAVGHFGAYREGVGPLVGRLRETFDPRAFSRRGGGPDGR